MGNKGALIRFEAPELKPNIVTFSAVVSSFLLSLTILFFVHHLRIPLPALLVEYVLV